MSTIDASRVMGMSRVMKPFWRFEYWYDRTTAPALRGNIPIALFPTGNNIPAATDPPGIDGRAYDQMAGNNGYSASLAAMLPMPAIGSDVLLWIPHINGQGGEAQTDYSHCYLYVPIWRMRPVGAVQRTGIQGNVVRQSFGTPDTSFTPAADRYILPAAMSHVLLAKQEFDQTPAVRYDPTFLQPTISLRDGIAMPTSVSTVIDDMPISPDGGTLTYEQGILDGILNGNTPNFKPHWLKVMGNELGFWVYKINYPSPSDTEIVYADWDFRYDPATGYCSTAAEDVFFSQFFGVGSIDKPGHEGLHPEAGLYVMTGTTSG